MNLRMENGLPYASVTLTYNGKSLELNNVLFDTGCATTVFDTDLLSVIGIELDILNGTAKRMYGIGGNSELCYEQTISRLHINSLSMPPFRMQLGMMREPYGFDGILGIDFITAAGLIVDFGHLNVSYGKAK